MKKLSLRILVIIVELLLIILPITVAAIFLFSSPSPDAQVLKLPVVVAPALLVLASVIIILILNVYSNGIGRLTEELNRAGQGDLTVNIEKGGVSELSGLSDVVQRPRIWGELAVKRLNDLMPGREVPEFEDAGTFEINKRNVSLYN